jgi:hypothetical protein
MASSPLYVVGAGQPRQRRQMVGSRGSRWHRCRSRLWSLLYRSSAPKELVIWYSRLRTSGRGIISTSAKKGRKCIAARSSRRLDLDEVHHDVRHRYASACRACRGSQGYICERCTGCDGRARDIMIHLVPIHASRSARGKILLPFLPKKLYCRLGAKTFLDSRKRTGFAGVSARRAERWAGVPCSEVYKTLKSASWTGGQDRRYHS